MRGHHLALRLFFQHYYSLEWLRKFIFMKRIELQRIDSEPITKRFYHLWFLIRLAQDEDDLIADIIPVIAVLLNHIESCYYSHEGTSNHWIFFYADFRKKISRLSEGGNPKIRKLWENLLTVVRNAEIKEIRFIIDQNLPLFLEAKKALELSCKYEDIGQLSRDDQLSILTQWADLLILQRQHLEWKRSEEDLEQYISMAISPIVLSLQEIHGSQFSKEDYDALTWLSLKSNEFAFFPRNLNPINLPAVSVNTKLLKHLVQFVLGLENFQNSLSSFKRRVRSRMELQNIKDIVSFLDHFALIFDYAFSDLIHGIDLSNFDSIVGKLASLNNAIRYLGNEVTERERNLIKSINHMKKIRETYAQSKEFDLLLQKKFTEYQENIITCYSHILKEFSHGQFQTAMTSLPQFSNLKYFPVYFEGCTNFKFLEDYYKLSIQPDSLYSPIYSRVLNMSIVILAKFPEEIKSHYGYNPFTSLPYYELVKKVLSSLLDEDTQSVFKLKMANEMLDTLEELAQPVYREFKFHREIRSLLAEIISTVEKAAIDEVTFYSAMHDLKEVLIITNKLHFQLHSLRVFLIMSDSNGDKQTIEKVIDLFPQSPFKAYFTLLQRIICELPRSKLECDLTALESMIHEDRVLDPTLLQEICEMCQSLFEEFCDPSRLWKRGIRLRYSSKDKAAISDSFVFLLHCFLAVVHNERYLFDQWKSLFLSSSPSGFYGGIIKSSTEENIKFLVAIERFTILRQRSRADIALIFKNMITDKNESFDSKTRRKGMIIFEKALSLMHTPDPSEAEINGLLDLCLLYFNLIESKRPKPKNKKSKIMKGSPSLSAEKETAKSGVPRLNAATIEAQINQILELNPSFQSFLNPQHAPIQKSKKSSKK